MTDELWGLETIASYAGWKDRRSPVRAMKREGFLMFRRRRAGHPKPIWFTTKGLVHVWMISKCKVDRERLLEQEAGRVRRSAVGAEGVRGREGGHRGGRPAGVSPPRRP